MRAGGTHVLHALVIRPWTREDEACAEKGGKGDAANGIGTLFYCCMFFATRQETTANGDLTLAGINKRERDRERGREREKYIERDIRIPIVTTGRAPRGQRRTRHILNKALTSVSLSAVSVSVSLTKTARSVFSSPILLYSHTAKIPLPHD